MKSPTVRQKPSLTRKICIWAFCQVFAAGALVWAFGGPHRIKAAGVASAPFRGHFAAAGQPIQAANYDLGGEDVAYHAATQRKGATSYRPDDAGITTGGSNGFCLGPTSAGQWLQYTLSVPTGGVYVFSARASAALDGARFHAEFDGTNLTGSLPVPKSAARNNWSNVTARPFHLTAGLHAMRVIIDSNPHGPESASSFDEFNLTPVVAPGYVRWFAAAPTPVNRFEGYARAFHGKLFTLGGYKSLIHPYAINTDAAVYDVASNQWRSLGTAPVAPTHAGLAEDNQTGTLYFVGGLQGAYPGVATTEVWSYDTNNNAWAPLPPLPVPLAAGDAAFVDGDLHYFAGIGADSRVTNLNVHCVLKQGETRWRAAAPFPTPRDHVTAVVLNGMIYVFGGEIGHDAHHMQQTLAHAYDPATDTWKRLADMPVSKSHAESSAFVSHGKIIIAGGQVDHYASTDTVLQYDPASNTWSFLFNLPGPLQGTILQPTNNLLILTGGYDGTYMKNQTWLARWPQ